MKMFRKTELIRHLNHLQPEHGHFIEAYKSKVAVQSSEPARGQLPW